ncbi:MAG TPA: hypothetical protein VKR32_04160 [Puia sp.]|nr:hypothetical protein [Puia sp.]
MKKYIGFIAALLSMILVTCSKSGTAPVLPPITQTGANTFGCKINGQVWVPNFPCYYASTGGTQLAYNISSVDSGSVLPIYFAILAGNFNGYKYGQSYFKIYCNNISGPVAYLRGLGNVADSLYLEFDATIDANGDFLQYGPAGNSAVFQITKLDTVNGIVSGIFNFNVYASGINGGVDSLSITEGRFDLRIGQYDYCSN